MKIKYLLLIIIASANIACDDFLNKPTSKTSSLQPTTVDQLESLLESYSSFVNEDDYISMHASDDFAITSEIHNAKGGQGHYGVDLVKLCLWDTEYLPDYNRHYFPTEWRRIFTANMIIANLPKVTGSAEKKEQIKLEAHFIRAYSYLKLLTTYCLPLTEATKNEMGLPIKNTISFEENPTRATLEETYAFLEADLEQALKLERKMVVINNKNNSWRANKGAVNAFAARYWLIRGDYDKSLTYANAALEEHSTLVDYNVDMRYSSITSIVKDKDNKDVQLLYPYTHDNQSDPTDMMEWKEFYYFKLMNNIWWWYIPSDELISLYDKQYDLRYKYHYVEQYSLDRGIKTKDILGYIFFFKDRLPSGPTVAEMLLTKAECQARKGDQWQQAMTTVNILRRARMDNTANSSIINISAASQSEALKRVLEERRRELPFTIRWSDIRRFNHNSDPSDDVILKKKFYKFNSSTILSGEAELEYKLENGSRKYASPLPRVDIDATLGVLKQNIY